MWYKAIWKGHPVRLELTRIGLVVELANHYTQLVSLPKISLSYYIPIARRKNSSIYTFPKDISAMGISRVIL